MMEQKPRQPGENKMNWRTTNGDQHRFNKEDNEGGWQIVRGRRQRASPQQRKGHTNFCTNTRNNGPKQEKNIYFRNKCFRCLSKKYQIAQCREPLRCCKCLQLGHYSHKCSIKLKPFPPKTHTNFQSKFKNSQSYAETVRPKQQTMNNDNLESFWNERPEEEDVFLPTHQALRPANQYLDSAA